MLSYYHDEMLFSEIYLEEITQEVETADLLAALKVITEYRDFADKSTLKGWKDSYVHEVLSALGFYAKPKSESLTELFPMGTGDGKPCSLCYIVLPDESLDNTIIGRNWAEKIIRALRENALQWGILTNGKQWRIYHQDEPTPYETYLEIGLEAIMKDKAKDAYQLFHKFMKAENFTLNEDGKCQFDLFKKESQDKIDYIEKELAKALKQREEGGQGVLSDLCMGYVQELRQRAETNLDDEEQRKTIYHSAMLYMFRLLFLFYADARGLLSDDNHTLLEKIETECRARYEGAGSGTDSFGIWGSLEEIFVDIDQTYNGGLFSPQESKFTEFLSDTCIGDNYLMNVIYNLSTYQEKNKQVKPISYRDMSVRHLGTLYEGLLEHKLFIAQEDTEVKLSKGKIQFIPASQGGKLKVGSYIRAGEVYFAGDASERKATGSYYTPEYIVDYIVRNTVGEKLKEVKETFLKEQQSTIRAITTALDEEEQQKLSKLFQDKLLAFVREEVLNLSVLDPAMGSGHFLVNATTLISNFFTEILNEINIQGDQESGTGYWRRWVVENCIYGVDLNPLAVELAKLSIWILSMAKDQPLSFLNHHLKTGNSLVGATLEEIGNYPLSSVKKEQQQPSLFSLNSDLKTDVEFAIEKFRFIAEKTSTQLNDVREKKDWLKDIDQILEQYKLICDFHTNVYFDNQLNEEDYSTIIEKGAFNQEASVEKPHRYFHWELEFPNLFFGSTGYICIIGNPPWGGKMSEKDKKYLSSIFKFVHMRTPDTFNYFLAKAYVIAKTIRSGVIGFINPSNFLFQHEYANARRFFLENASFHKVVNLGDSVFDATAPCSIEIICIHGEQKNQEIRIIDLRNIGRDLLPIRLDSSMGAGILKTDILETPDLIFPTNKSSSEILIKILASCTSTLGDLAEEVASGISTGGDKIFRQKNEEVKSLCLESDILRPVLVGRQIQPFFVPESTGYQLIYTTKDTELNKYPKVKSYLHKYKSKLEENAEAKQGKMPWWRLHRPRFEVLFNSPKILLRQTADSLIAAVDPYGHYCLNSVIILRLNEENLEHFLVGLLNSKLIRWVYRNLTQEENRVFAEVKPVNLRKLPIHLIDQDNPVEIELYTKITKLVNEFELLQNQRYLVANFNSEEYADIQKEINYSVYKLYGLDDIEIDKIENANL